MSPKISLKCIRLTTNMLDSEVEWIKENSFILNRWMV
jgi:hypothetical protein